MREEDALQELQGHLVSEVSCSVGQFEILDAVDRCHDASDLELKSVLSLRRARHVVELVSVGEADA